MAIEELELAAPKARDREKPRERLLGAAYERFAAKGVGQVGIETILAKSGCAKASLYSNFDSKVDLAIAFLDRREAVWTRGWLEAEIKRLASTPEQRLLTIFDVFDGWFRKKTFEGCSFINVLLNPRRTARCAAPRESTCRRSGQLSATLLRKRACATRRNLRRPGIC